MGNWQCQVPGWPMTMGTMPCYCCSYYMILRYSLLCINTCCGYGDLKNEEGMLSILMEENKVKVRVIVTGETTIQR